uniref:Sodium/calcium exchanger membrane region domain-containing protein n=1 Tax=Knipowitschia caucasica TaxID=637954 RepID=A0AAV2KAT1_KNICA
MLLKAEHAAAASAFLNCSDREPRVLRRENKRESTVCSEDLVRFEVWVLPRSRAIHEFPKDFFSSEERKSGAVLLHIVATLYMFLALAITCDEYFVTSLEKICEKLDLSEDVAGATFMAAGSSAPELFASIIGVFITHGDVGVGTIVGSAVFNILCIIGVCGIFAGQVVMLTFWAVFRDSFYYILSVIALIAFIYDEKIVWWESVVLVVMYAGYILVMKFNSSLQRCVTGKTNKKNVANGKAAVTGSELEDVKPTKDYSRGSVVMVDEMIHDSPSKFRFPEAGLRVMVTSHFGPKTRLRMASRLIITEKLVQTANGVETQVVDGKVDMENGTVPEDKKPESEPSDTISPFHIPRGCGSKIKWLISWPLLLLLFFTVPNCAKPRWEKFFMLSFFLSTVWIAVFSYVMVWMLWCGAMVCCVAMVCCGVVCCCGVLLWRVAMVCCCGVLLWCVGVVWCCGVVLWCVAVALCCYGVLLWCVGVLLWCVAVACCCGVVVWCGAVVCCCGVLCCYGVLLWCVGVLLWCGAVVWCCGVLLWRVAVVWWCGVVLWCVAVACCVAMVCCCGVLLWCCCGVVLWCGAVVWCCGVLLWRVAVACCCGVVLWCGAVVCCCGVVLWCVAVACCVAMVTIIGFTLGIPDVIMGITFLAAGTSVPDCIASLIVARQGLGDMAVSNTIGSNVFDILVGLGLPWFLQTVCISYGSEVMINSRGLVYSVVLLLGSVALTVLGIHLNKWRLDFKLGVYVLILYAIFLCFSILIEFNVFTFVNLPMCMEP